MIRNHLLILMLLLGIITTKAQNNYSRVQTLDYIHTISNYEVKVGSIGNISIDDKIKFHYSNIVIRKQSDTELEFRCKLGKGNCIELNEPDSRKEVFSYKIKLNKKILYNIYNAFDYLLKLLTKEKPEQNTDPFSPSNYNKKIKT